MLKEEYLQRKRRRPAYSERAFARDLRVSPGYVSLLFRGHRSLSPARGLQIVNRLGWSEEKSQLFIEHLQRRAVAAAFSKKTLLAVDNKAPFSELGVDKFRFIANMDHVAVLTLIQAREGLNTETVAKILDLSIVEAELVTHRLIRLGLLQVERGQYKCTKKSLELKEIPSEAIRSFHRQAIQKAEASIEEQTPAERNLSALTVSLDPAKMEQAKACLNRFLKSFEKKFGRASNGEIYQLNTQLFRLSKGKK